PKAAASSAASSASMPGTASDIEQIPHGLRRVLENVEAHLQQRQSGHIEMAHVKALLDRRPDEPRRAEPHAAFERRPALGRAKAAGARVSLEKGAQYAPHR